MESLILAVKKVFITLLIILKILVFIQFISTTLMILGGLLTHQNTCWFRYAEQDGHLKSNTLSSFKDVNLRANANYHFTEMQDEDQYVSQDPDSYGEWLDAGEVSGDFDLSIEGSVSLCQSYVPDYNLQKNERFNKKIKIPRRGTGEYLRYIFPARSNNRWRNVAEIFPNDEIKVLVGPPITRSNSTGNLRSVEYEDDLEHESRTVNCRSNRERFGNDLSAYCGRFTMYSPPKNKSNTESLKYLSGCSSAHRTVCHKKKKCHREHNWSKSGCPPEKYCWVFPNIDKDEGETCDDETYYIDRETDYRWCYSRPNAKIPVMLDRLRGCDGVFPDSRESRCASENCDRGINKVGSHHCKVETYFKPSYSNMPGNFSNDQVFRYRDNNNNNFRNNFEYYFQPWHYIKDEYSGPEACNITHERREEIEDESEDDEEYERRVLQETRARRSRVQNNADQLNFWMTKGVGIFYRYGEKDTRPPQFHPADGSQINSPSEEDIEGIDTKFYNIYSNTITSNLLPSGEHGTLQFGYLNLGYAGEKPNEDTIRNLGMEDIDFDSLDDARYNNGGYAVYIQHTKCRRENGQIISDTFNSRGAVEYVVLPKKYDLNEILPRGKSNVASDLESKNISFFDSGFFDFSRGNQRYEVKKGDVYRYGKMKMWLKIMNDPDDYKDSSGEYKVQFNNTSDVGKFTDLIINPLIGKVGEKIEQAGEVLFAKLTCINLHKNFGCQNFFMYIRSILTLYVIYLATMFLLGRMQMNYWELVIHIVKIVIIAGLINGNTFLLFQDLVFSSVFRFIDGIIGSITGFANDPFSFLDEALSRLLFNKTTLFQILSLISGGSSGIMYFVIVLVSIILFMISAFQFLATYILAKLYIAFLLGFAPIFLTFILFPITRSYFDNWINNIVKYMLEPIVFVLGIHMFSNLFVYLLDNVLAYSVCFKCSIPFKIPLGSVPNSYQDLYLFCFYWFGPWGLDQRMGLFALPPQSLLGLLLISLVSYFYPTLVSGFVSHLTNGMGPGAATAGAEAGQNFASFVKNVPGKAAATALKPIAKGAAYGASKAGGVIAKGYGKVGGSAVRGAASVGGSAARGASSLAGRAISAVTPEPVKEGAKSASRYIANKGDQASQKLKPVSNYASTKFNEAKDIWERADQDNNSENQKSDNNQEGANEDSQDNTNKKTLMQKVVGAYDSGKEYVDKQTKKMNTYLDGDKPDKESDQHDNGEDSNSGGGSKNS